jgi:hypothetical protein
LISEALTNRREAACSTGVIEKAFFFFIRLRWPQLIFNTKCLRYRPQDSCQQCQSLMQRLAFIHDER